MPKWKLNKATKRLCPNKFGFIFTTQGEALHHKATTDSLCQVVVVSQNALKTQEVSTISTNDVCYWIIKWCLFWLLGKNTVSRNFIKQCETCTSILVLSFRHGFKFWNNEVFKVPHCNNNKKRHLISALIASFSSNITKYFTPWRKKSLGSKFSKGQRIQLHGISWYIQILLWLQKPSYVVHC